MTSLHLASSSARRVDILTALGVSFTAAGVDIDETPFPGETARDMVLRLAIEKARAAAPGQPLPVLAADTAVTLDGQIFGKPRSADDALAMLGALSGRTHQVMTAVALVGHGRESTALSVTDVSFRRISATEAQRYWDSGEPQGKAGAYAIQGRGGVFVERIDGSYSGVVGLPVYETARLFDEAGVPFLPDAG